MFIFVGGKTQLQKVKVLLFTPSPCALKTGGISDWLIYMAELCANVCPFALKTNDIKFNLNLFVVDVSNSNLSIVI